MNRLRRSAVNYKTHVLEYVAEQKDAGMKLMDVLHQSMDLSGRMIRRSKKEKAICNKGKIYCKI